MAAAKSINKKNLGLETLRVFKDKFNQIREANEILNAEEVLEREVTEFGTGAHIVVPQKHIGKKAKVIIKENK